MTALYPPQTDHERVMAHLARMGRRYEVQVWNGGSLIVDRGKLRRKKRGQLVEGRSAKATMIRFDARFKYAGTNRPLKAWWLLRGLDLV